MSLNDIPPKFMEPSTDPDAKKGLYQYSEGVNVNLLKYCVLTSVAIVIYYPFNHSHYRHNRFPSYIRFTIATATRNVIGHLLCNARKKKPPRYPFRRHQQTGKNKLSRSIYVVSVMFAKASGRSRALINFGGIRKNKCKQIVLVLPE
jgi:hypothetical protein